MLINKIYAFISLSDAPTVLMPIKDCYEVVNEIILMEADDILNIKGLGRLVVLDVEHGSYPSDFDENNMYHVYNITCKWISDEWAVS